MPRTTKDTKKDEKEVKKKSTKTSTTSKATAETKKSAKTTTQKKRTSSPKASSTKSSVTKTTSSKATNTKKTNSTTKKKTSTSSTKRKTTTSKAKVKKVENNIIAEYYDLPYRYNETIVKILYQTPKILFVYWDISDDDRNNLISQYGEHFFYNTKPILKVFNLTKNYDFEVEINDFANSWYINVNDANCNYKIELARKTIKYEENITQEYLPITSSNNLEFPNDHILIDELPNIINFRNAKTNASKSIDISTLRLIGINKIYNIHDFYKKLYKDEIWEEINSEGLINSSSPSSWC